LFYEITIEIFVQQYLVMNYQFLILAFK